MKREEATRVKNTLIKLIEGGGDNCTLCDRPFRDEDVTFGGTVSGGAVQLVGECCANQLIGTMSMMGLYRVSAAQLAADIARRGGLQGQQVRLTTSPDAPWQKDDLRWFHRNRSRTHRIRLAHAAEYKTFGELPPPPVDHVLCVLVRQVEPGKRIRVPFFRAVMARIPDNDAAISRLIDMIARGGGQVITVNDITCAQSDSTVH